MKAAAVPDSEPGRGTGPRARLGARWAGGEWGTLVGPAGAVVPSPGRQRSPRSAQIYELLKSNNSRKTFALGLIQYPFDSSWFFLLLGAELFSFGHGCNLCCDPASRWPLLRLLCRVSLCGNGGQIPPWAFWMTTDFFPIHSVLSQEQPRGVVGMRREKTFLAATFT